MRERRERDSSNVRGQEVRKGDTEVQEGCGQQWWWYEDGDDADDAA